MIRVSAVARGRGRGAPPWLPIAGLLALGAGIRALRFAGRFATPYHWDETGIAIPALHLLHGILPVDFLGNDYMGAPAAYPLAAWFAAAGSSTAALDAFAYATGLAVLGTGYLVLRRLLEPGAACVALAVLAVPPLLLAKRSLSSALDYPVLLLLGNLFLLGAHTLFFRRPGRRRALLVLGLLAGVGWWQTPLFLVYLAPFGLLALRTGLAWQPRIGWFAAGALVGGLPAWLYELRYFPSSRFAVAGVGSAPVEPFVDRARVVIGAFLPAVLGAPRAPGGGTAEAVVVLLGALLPAALAVARAAARDRGELRWTIGAGGAPARGQVLLWGVAAANLGLVFLTPRGALGDRYLLPLYAVLPCWAGEMLHWLRGRRRLIGGLAIGGILAFHLWSNWMDTLGGTPPSERRWAPVERRVSRLFQELRAHGTREVYWAIRYPPAYELTYLMGGDVQVADLWREPDVRRARAVDAAVSPPVVVPVAGDEPERLIDSLRGIGMALRETPVGEFRIVEAMPRFATGFVPLPRDGWTATASRNPEMAANLLDRDASTGWTSGRSQRPGEWVAVDLAGSRLITRVDLLALDWQDMPAGFRVEVSPDGVTWATVVSVPRYWGPLFFSEHHAFLKARRGRIQAIFAPVRARFVRIVQTGEVAHRGWAARDLFVYGPGRPLPRLPRPGEITAALQREGVDRVFTDHWLAAWVRTESRGTILAPDSNLNLNAYGRTEPPPERLLPFRLDRGSAILLGSDADPAEIRVMLAGQGIEVRETAAGPYRLLVWAGGAAVPRRLSRAGWRASASEHGDQAGQAIDGGVATRWTAVEPSRPDASFTLDLGAVRRVRGLRVTPPPPGASGGLHVAGSADGRTWATLAPLAWAGRLYWSGSELLRNGARGWAVRFPPADVRYLRLQPATRAGRLPWSIAEIDCFD